MRPLRRPLCRQRLRAANAATRNAADDTASGIAIVRPIATVKAVAATAIVVTAIGIVTAIAMPSRAVNGTTAIATRRVRIGGAAVIVRVRSVRHARRRTRTS